MLRGLGRYWWRHRWGWLGGLAATAAGVGANLTVPRAIGLAIDDLRAGGADLHRHLAVVLGAATVSAVFFVVMRRLVATASRTVAYELRRDLFHRLTLMEPAYFHAIRTGDLMNRFTGDLSAIQEMLGFGVVQGTQTVFTLLLTLTMMLRLSLPLGLLVLGLFPVVVGLLFALLRATARRYAAVQEQQSIVAAKAQENFSGIRVVKGYAMEDRELRDYTRLNEVYRGRVLRLARVEGPLWAAVGLLMNLVFVGVILLASRQLLSAPVAANAGEAVGGLTLGEFIAFITYLFQLSWPLLSIGVLSNVVQRGAVSWGRLREVLDAQPGVTDPPVRSGAGAPLTPFAVSLSNRSTGDTRGPSTASAGLGPIRGPEAPRGELRFERVGLTLGGRTQLADIDLVVPAGTTLGITGRTGSGKSLLSALVSRLLDPTSGRVLLDGVDVRELPLQTLRGSLGVVTQEPFLFSATLAQNIGFGLPQNLTPDGGVIDSAAEPATAQLEQAAERAGLDVDLQSFPGRLSTVIGERGVTLSGGQRQRTALARAIAREPAVLILDDALSAVDTETEAKILDRLREVMRGRTVLLISHRVSTLRQADEIIVLEEGRIVERGSHAQLLAQGGRYAELEGRQRLEQVLSKSLGLDEAGKG